VADEFQRALMSRTAEKFQTLAALRGLSGLLVEVTPEGRYLANGIDCGTSVHSLYQWLEKTLKAHHQMSSGA
jgi:hypothetical protein